MVDLLDRVLDRGLVINADIIICLAGVPLVGINLRAALAGMETMGRYGLMDQWDDRTRLQDAARQPAATGQGTCNPEEPTGSALRTYGV